MIEPINLGEGWLFNFRFRRCAHVLNYVVGLLRRFPFC